MKMMKLSSLGCFRNGMNYEKSAVTDGYKMIGVADFGNRVFPDIRSLSEIDSSIVSEENLLQNGDILFVRSNGNKNLVGRSMFMRNIEEPICYSGFCILLRPNLEIVLPEYLFYALRSPFCRKQYSYSQQTNITNLSQTVLGAVDVPVPDIEAQRNLSGILSYLDQKIALNSQLCTELESMAKTLYDYWFTQFDFPDENGKPYRSSGGEMVWNDQLKCDLPKGWAVTTMSALTTVLTGKEDANFSTPSGNYKFFTCAQETIFCDIPAFSGHAILIAGNGDFNVKHYTGSFNAYQRTYVLIPKDPKYYAIMYIVAQQQIQAFKQGSNGSIVKFITKGDVENIPIILPDNDVCLDALNRILDKIEHCECENDELTKLRDWLLPMLMNGQAIVE